MMMYVMCYILCSSVCVCDLCTMHGSHFLPVLHSALPLGSGGGVGLGGCRIECCYSKSNLDG